jgi:regulator of protease activity HflC (stomatin/prohibitin superfamily)
MVEIFGWLGAFPNFIISLFPHIVIVRSTHMGVKFKHGSEEVVLEPGIHWYWPVVTECEVVAVKYRTTNLPAQYLETKDGRKVGCGGIVTYGIDDIRAALCECWDYEDVIADKSLAAIKHVVTTNPYDYFKGSDADKRLTTRLQRELKDYGIEVSRVQLSDFAESRMLAVWGLSSTTSEE